MLAVQTGVRYGKDVGAMSDCPRSKVGATVVSLSMLLSMVPTPALAQAVEEDKAIIDQMADRLFGDGAETVSSNEEPVQEELVNSGDVSSDNAEVSETSDEVDASDGDTDAGSPASTTHDISLASVRAWILGLSDGTAYIAPESGFQAPTFILSLDGEELPDDEKEAEGNSVREEDLIRDYDAEEEELVQQSADEDIE